MNPELTGQAQGLIYGELEDFANDMMSGGPDFLQNRAKPENIPGDDPAEPGVTFSDEDMGMLEAHCSGAKDSKNY